jgi:hypothetical protein
LAGDVSPIGEIQRNICSETPLASGSFALARSAADSRLPIRFASLSVNVPALTNFRPHFAAGLGWFCRPFDNLLIEWTGKAFALRANRWPLGAYSGGVVLGNPSENSEKR